MLLPRDSTLSNLIMQVKEEQHKNLLRTLDRPKMMRL